MSAPAIIARRALLSPVDGYSHCAGGESNGRCDRSPFLNREQLRSILPRWPSFGSERYPRWLPPALEARLHFLQSGKRRIANLLRLWEDSYRIPIGGRHGAKTYGSSTGCALEAHGVQPPEMEAAAKPSSQPRTKSCVMSGDGHCEA